MAEKETPNLNPEQMKAFAEFLLPLLQEIKKPNELEAIQLAEKKTQMAAKLNAQKEAAIAEVNREKLREKMCDHMGSANAAGQRKHLWRAQVHTPGGETKPYFQPVCSGCWKVGPKINATPQQI